MSVESPAATRAAELIPVPGVDLQVAQPLSSTPQPVTDGDGGETGLQLALAPEAVIVTTPLNVSGPATLSGGLAATTAMFVGAVSVGAPLVVESLTVMSDAVLSGSVTAGSVTVAGVTTLAAAAVNGDLSANGALSARGRASLFSGAPVPVPLPGAGRRTVSRVANTDGFVIVTGPGTLTIGALSAEADRSRPAMLPVQAGGTFSVAAQAGTAAYFMPMGQVTPPFQ